MATTNEVAFNTVFAEALRNKSPRWKHHIGAEQGHVLKNAPGQRPDIVVDPPRMAPVVIETEFVPAATVEQDAVARLDQTLLKSGKTIENVIALKIPERLRTTAQADLLSEISNVKFDTVLLRASGGGHIRWPESGWLSQQIDDVARSIETVALSERAIKDGMDAFRDGVERCTQFIEEAKEVGFVDPVNHLAKTLHQEPSLQTTRMGMAILANAINFHNAIAGSHGITPPDLLHDKMALIEEWDRILNEINYWPIFSIARDILKPLPLDTSMKIIDRLQRSSAKLVNVGAISMHDLSGRMLQQLIADRKFLATFYTLPTSAALLAELSVSRLEHNWSDPASYRTLRIADLSCGTGTLISAAYSAILSMVRRQGIDDAATHKEMMEEIIIAADIMPVATHLAASQLSSAHPTITFGKCKVYTMPYGDIRDPAGEQRTAIGSLDLFGTGPIDSIFATALTQLSGTQEHEDKFSAAIPNDSLNLVIMNPPFTRPTNHEIANVPVPSFAGFKNSEDEQKKMSKKLKEYIARVKRARLAAGIKEDVASNGNAGLASNFFDLAHAKIRDSGVLALVLPFSFVSGESWRDARDLLQRYYTNVLIISLATTGGTMRAFSADTGMAEVLIVAERCEMQSKFSTVTYVNLLRRPKSLLEAIETARLIKQIDSFSETAGFGRIDIGNEKHGTYVCASVEDGGCAGLHESALALTMIKLRRGELSLPQGGDSVYIPITLLASIGSRGLVHRDVAKRGIDVNARSAFEIRTLLHGSEPTICGLWNHSASRERRLIVQPDVELIRRRECDDQKFNIVMSTASRLHFALDFQINSQSLASCVTPRPMLGGSAWPNFKPFHEIWERILLLWANSTIGVMTFWWHGTRQQQGRSRMTITKLPDLPIIDPRKLSSDQIALSNRVFDKLSESDFLPANEAWRDDVRQKLDRMLLCDILGLSDNILDPLSSLRRQWCNEPSVHGGKDTRPVY